jgi:hypothetical protein
VSERRENIEKKDEQRETRKERFVDGTDAVRGEEEDTC